MENNKNIFEGAKFGDKFITQANYEAIYIETIQRAYKYHRLIIKNGVGISDIECTEDGIAQHSPECNNIVSKYIEPIDENVGSLTAIALRKHLED